jgi:phosphatidate cytidylyltransferase
MKQIFDSDVILIYGTVFVLLLCASLIAGFMRRHAASPQKKKLMDEVVLRINAWWVLAGSFGAVVFLGPRTTMIFFFFVSLFALREYMSLIDTRPADHRALLWTFLIVAPAQYYLVLLPWYGLFTVFIPVYAFLAIPSLIAMRGDCESFLERTAKIQWGIMICVFMISHAPAILTLDIAGFQGKQFKLLFYLVFITEMSDVFQFICGKSFGRRKIAPTVSPNKTWEGFLGGMALTMLMGVPLSHFTPFSAYQSMLIAALIVVCGFLGGLVMSAIKRDHNVKDYGHLIPGHGGMLDRFDSLCFAAPIFFHVVRYFF